MPRTLDAARVVNTLDVTQATGVAMSVDAQNNVHCTGWLTADEIQTVRKVISGDIVVDKDGNVRDGHASRIAYTDTGNVLGTPTAPVNNIQAAIEAIAAHGGGSGGASALTIADTATAKALNGVTLEQKLSSLYPTREPPKKGDLIFVGLDRAGADNEYAGIMVFDGNRWQLLIRTSDSRPDPFNANTVYKQGDLLFHSISATDTEQGLWIALKDVPKGTWNWDDVEGGGRRDNWRLVYSKLAEPKAPLDGYRVYYSKWEGQEQSWEDGRHVPLVVANRLERLDLRYPEDVNTGTLVTEIDNGEVYRFSAPDITPLPPAVTMGIGPIAPTGSHPLGGFTASFNGLPAAAQTTIEVRSTIKDQFGTLRRSFRFTIPATADINAVQAALATVFTGWTLTVLDSTSIQMTAPAGTAIMDTSIIAQSLPDPNAPVGSHNWKLVDNYIIVPDFNAIENLDRGGKSHSGMLVCTEDTGHIYAYLDGQWRQQITQNPNTHILSALHYDPELLPHDRLDWKDARQEMVVVSTRDDLNDRFNLPHSHLVPGKLAFVIDEGIIYEHIADDTTRTDTAADWKPLVGGITYKGRARDLPSPLHETMVDGQAFIIRQDFAGHDLYRLVTWDSTLPGTPGVPAQPPVTIAPATDRGPIAAINDLMTFSSNPALVAGDWAQVTGTLNLPTGDVIEAGSTILWTADVTQGLQGMIVTAPTTTGGVTTVPVPANAAPPTYGAIATFSGAPNMDLFDGAHTPPLEGQYLVHTGGGFTFPAADPQYPNMGSLAGTTITANDFIVRTSTDWIVVAAGSADHATIQGGGTVTLGGAVTNAPTPPASHVIPGTAAILPVPGGWRYINRKIWDKQLKTAPDQDTDQQANDLQITRSGGHEEIKAWNAASDTWDTIYSRDTINAAIAAMSLFEGTATNPGHPAPGAVEFPKLPNLVHMTAAGDLSKVSHYYTYIGTPGFTVESPAAAKATAGAAWKDVTVLGGNINHAAGQQLVVLFLVDGQPATQVGVARYLTIEFDATTLVGQEKDQVTIHLDATDTGTEVATKLEAAWVDGTLGLNSVSAGNSWNLTPTDPTVHVTNMVLRDGGTPIIGDDLNGAVLNPGDWLQIANRGTAAAPDLHWVTVGGDLLAKARADRLYSLMPWSAGGFEQGSLVLYQGDVYRAVQGVTGTDGPPVGVPQRVGPLTVPVAAATAQDASGAALPVTGVTAGIWHSVTAAGTFPTGTTIPFSGVAYEPGDRFLWTGDATFTGMTVQGLEASHGWIRFPHVGATSNPSPLWPTTPPSYELPPPTNNVWTRLDISGGLKVAQTDGDLPGIAPAGQVWIVLSSAQAGGKQGLFSFDTGASVWQQLGGGGIPLTLTGGTIVYPSVIYHSGEPLANLSDPAIVQPRIVGDVLVCQNQNGNPLIEAVSQDGRTWKELHPSRLTFDSTGASKVARADHPLQFNVGITGGQAYITHVADRSRNWVPIAQPVIPTVPIVADRATSRPTSSEAARIPGLLTGMAAVLQPSKFWIGFHGSQDEGQNYHMTFHELLQVNGDLFAASNQTQTKLVSGNVAWFDVTWNDNNRIYGSNVSFLYWSISTALFNDRVAFRAHFTYNRHSGFQPSQYEVWGYVAKGSNIPMRTTLVQFGLDTGTGEVVTNSRLLNTW